MGASVIAAHIEDNALRRQFEVRDAVEVGAPAVALAAHPRPTQHARRATASVTGLGIRSGKARASHRGRAIAKTGARRACFTLAARYTARI
jgi:hypothetical protein